MSMNPYEPVDPRPNTVEVPESSEILHDGLVQEDVEGEDGEKITITTMEVPTEKETSVANRDFSEDLKLYMAKYPAYQHMLGMEVPMRSYMWSFFGGIVNTRLCEELKLNDAEDYWKNNPKQLLANSGADIQHTAKHLDEYGPQFDLMIDAVIDIAMAYLKLAGYEDKFVVPSPPEEKDVVEEIVEKELGE